VTAQPNHPHPVLSRFGGTHLPSSVTYLYNDP